MIGCPKNIIGSWEDEIALHLIKDHGCEFVIHNYEYIRIHIDELCEEEWDFIILDESHRTKNRKAKTTKAVWKLEAIYKIIMSGTPVPKDEIDLWSQFKFLNPSLWGNNFKAFAAKALREKDMGDYITYEPHPKNIKPFMKKAQLFTYRVALDDIAELPPKRDVPVYIRLSGKQKKAYYQLENSFMTEYEGKRSSMDLSVTSMIRLHQLIGGHLVLETNDVVRYKEQPKLWWIMDKLEDLGKEKLIIFCRFTLEIELIAAALKATGYKYCIMQGGMKKDETSRVRRAFQDPKGPQILIGQIQSIKEGNNFQHCCRYAVFYSKSLSYIDIEQCKARIYRNGQKRKVVYYHLIVKETIDEHIEDLVKKKHTNANRILLNLIIKGKHHVKEKNKPT